MHEPTAADMWTLRLAPSETDLLDRLRTFLNFYMDAAGLELQAIIHAQDSQHVAIAVAGSESKVIALRDRIQEMYPNEKVWLE